MKIHVLLIILYTTNVISTKDSYNPNDENDKVILWQELFKKVNTILLETEKINQNLMTINKRQEDQDKQIVKLLDNVNSNSNRIKKLMEIADGNSTFMKGDCLMSKERQEGQGNEIKKIIENSSSYHYLITKLMETADVHTKHLDEICLASNKGLDQGNQIIKLVEMVNLNLNESRLRPEEPNSQMMLLLETAKILNDTRLESNKNFNDLAKRQHDQVLLMMTSCNTKWTTILRRQDGSVNFFRNWTDYQIGFGNPPYGEFFIGLERLYELTTDAPQELMVIIKDWNNKTYHAHYDRFVIGGEDEQYVLKEVGKYTGDAGDSLRIHKGMKFSTWDGISNCAKSFKGAWWFKACYESHLNGPYRQEHESKQAGVSWFHIKSSAYVSYKYAEMKLRPKAV